MNAAAGSPLLNMAIFIAFVAGTMIIVIRASRGNKSAADYYNDYSPVQFKSLNAVMVTDSLWRVTCVFQW